MARRRPLMDLLGTLSNPESGASLRDLCRRTADAPTGSAPALRREDRRRRYRTIQRAVDAVLVASPQPLAVAEIQASVERLLGGRVAGSSVRNRLTAGTRTHPFLYERLNRG
jgi:hypothetical protein